MRIDLSDRFIASAKPGDYFDTRVRGLQVRVTPNGVRSWSVIFTSPTGGKRARLSLGRYPATRLARARALAGEAHGQIEQGIDPRGAGGPTSGDTVASLAEDYFRKHARTLRAGAKLERRIRNDVLPAIGSIRLTELHRRDTRRFVDPILERDAPISARRTFDDFRAIIRWGVGEGYLDQNPLAGAKAPPTSKPRERVLSDAEISQLWHAWPTVFNPAVVLALKLALVTAQRIGEVCGATVSEIDFAKRTWTLPGARTKNQHTHVVPLSDLALELIEQARADSDADRLFKMSASNVATQLVQKRDGLPVKEWTAHDLRRSAVTHMAELGVSPIVLGHIINHRSITKAGALLTSYQHYAYEKETRAALELWADRLAAIIGDGGAKVLPLRKGER
jgi:integrase